MCQLNYDCSGILEPAPLAGLRNKHVPFLKSSLSLCVGQTVSFRILSRGDDVQAVDISLESEVQRYPKREMDATADSSDLKTSSTLRRSVEKTWSLDSGDVMRSLQSHSRCFLRRMSQFRNSCQAEQVQLVVEAERSLDKLLGQSTLDGDAICRLARKCASWLHRPLLQTENPGILQSDHKSAGGSEDQVQLQERIRKILIKALNHLDLQDSSTFEAMKAALFYMASLCQRLDEKCDFSSSMIATTPARKQWLELKNLLEDSKIKSLDETSYQPPRPRVEDQSQPSLPPSATTTQDQGKVMADARRVAGVEDEPTRRRRIRDYYEPTARIKALSAVFQGAPVKLMCSECPFTVTSSWYLQHPKTLKRWVICPLRGHLTCRQKVKNCYWKNPDGCPVVRSMPSDLEYCPHKRLLGQCALCGGYKMCIHGKQRHHCKACKGSVQQAARFKKAVFLEVSGVGGW